MAKLTDSSRLCLACQCEAYKCRLQQRYTYLELNLDSDSGLVSEMFQRKVISFTEKRSIENIPNIHKRNKQVIDLFFAEKNNKQYLLFLDCLVASNQTHIREELESVSVCLSDLLNVPIKFPVEPQEKEYEEVGKIVFDNDLAVMGLCALGDVIYAICHMSSHISAYLSMPPFFNMPYLEFDLPVPPKRFHFYDMVGYPDENTLIISDKSNSCLWLANVRSKVTSQFVISKGSPTRMSTSRYARSCAGDDIYSENVVESNSGEDVVKCSSMTGGDGAMFMEKYEKNGDAFDIESFTQKLLLEKLRQVDKNCRTTDFTGDDARMLLVVVLQDGQTCVDFYDNIPKVRLVRRIPLMLGNDVVVSNVVQRMENGHLYMCYGKLEFDNTPNKWFLAEYSSAGKMLKSYEASYKCWIPRYIAVNTYDDCIYAINRYSGEVIKLKCDMASSAFEISAVVVSKQQFVMPSRLSFIYIKECKEIFMLVGQGEVHKPITPASILVLKKILK